jgi:signal recognition particle GTPase
MKVTVQKVPPMQFLQVLTNYYNVSQTPAIYKNQLIELKKKIYSKGSLVDYILEETLKEKSKDIRTILLKASINNLFVRSKDEKVLNYLLEKQLNFNLDLSVQSYRDVSGLIEIINTYNANKRNTRVRIDGD